MPGSDTTRAHRVAERVKTSTGSERAWSVVQAVVIASILGLAAAAVAMRDDLIVATTWSTVTAPAWHEKADVRFTHLERPELAIQLAQATGALHKVEAAAELAQENAAAIGVIQNDLGHVKDGGKRREDMLQKVLDKLDRLAVRSPAQ